MLGSVIAKEMADSVGFEFQDNKGIEDNLLELMGMINDMPEEDWKGLSIEAQTWFNDASEAFDADEMLPSFPDEKSMMEVVSEEDDDDEGDVVRDGQEDVEDASDDPIGPVNYEADGTPKVHTDAEQVLSDVLPANEGAEKTDKKSKKEVGSKSDGVAIVQPVKTKGVGRGNRSSRRGRRKPIGRASAGYRVKELLMDRGIDTPVKEIMLILDEEGYAYSKMTCETVRAEFRQTWRILQDKGIVEL